MKKMENELTESQLLECVAAGLWVEGEDNAKFKGNPATIENEEFPSDSTQGDRVDIVRDEAGNLAEYLLDTDTTASLGVRPKLNQVGCLCFSTSILCDVLWKGDLLYVRALFPML